METMEKSKIDEIVEKHDQEIGAEYDSLMKQFLDKRHINRDMEEAIAEAMRLTKLYKKDMLKAVLNDILKKGF